MIRVERLSASVRKTPILRDLSFSVKPGEFVALVGPNGAGKTTLLKHLNGLMKPTAGNVSVCGLDTRRARTSELARRVGFLFQNPDQQILCATVREEIAFGLRHCGIPRAEWDARIAEAAARADLSAKLDADPLMLTRSRRQRVALASVLATDPEVLVLDEPTSAQDEAETTRVMELARELARRGKAIVLVSHDMDLVARYADRALVLVSGKLEANCSPAELFADGDLLSRAMLSAPPIVRLASSLGLDLPVSGGDRAILIRSLADQIAALARREAV